jgi:hypothetical protein
MPAFDSTVSSWKTQKDLRMKKGLGFLAVAGLLVIAAPSQQASALSLANPAASAAAKSAPESLGAITEVRWHHHHWHHHWHHRWHHHRHW